MKNLKAKIADWILMLLGVSARDEMGIPFGKPISPIRCDRD